MVGRHHEQDGGRIAAHRELAGSRNGGRGIASLRFQNDGRLDALRAGLLGRDNAAALSGLETLR